MMEKVKKRLAREKKISSIRYILYIVILFFTSTLAIARIDILPSTGIDIIATPGVVAQSSVVFKPDASQTEILQYRLRTLRSNDQEIEQSRLTIENRYTQGVQTLERYRTVLSGQEKGNPVTSTFQFEPIWGDVPGEYVSSLEASRNAASDIPVKIIIKPKSLLTLQPQNFTITTSSLKSPVISEVNVVMGSNSPRWELYLVADNLKFKSSSQKISNDRVFVRIKDQYNPKPWLLLNKKLKLISGVATPITTVATLEFVVESELDDRAGDYLGNIKFLIRNFK